MVTKKIDNTILPLFIVIISAVVIIVIGEDVPKMPFGFHKAIFYFYYFYLGQLLCKYNSVILKYRGYIIGFCLLLVANQFWLKFNTHLGVIQYTTAFIILMYYIARAIPSKWYREKGVVSLICSYSFGIYVFHQWISWIVYKTPYTQSLFLQDAIRFAVAFTIIDLALSLLLTNLFFKNKIGKYLLT